MDISDRTPRASKDTVSLNRNHCTFHTMDIQSSSSSSSSSCDDVPHRDASSSSSFSNPEPASSRSPPARSTPTSSNSLSKSSSSTRANVIQFRDVCVLNKVENARVKGNTCTYAWWCVYSVPFQCLPFVSVVCRYVVRGRPVAPARIHPSTHQSINHIFISIQKKTKKRRSETKNQKNSVAREREERPRGWIWIVVFPPKNKSTVHKP